MQLKSLSSLRGLIGSTPGLGMSILGINAPKLHAVTCLLGTMEIIGDDLHADDLALLSFAMPTSYLNRVRGVESSQGTQVGTCWRIAWLTHRPSLRTIFACVANQPTEY